MSKSAMNNKQHYLYLDSWLQAMEYGLLGGRPYSQQCIRIYAHYVGEFLKTHHQLSVDNLNAVLLSIPVIHFAKRLKIYEALNCFARYLIQEGHLEADYLVTVKPFKPKRHLPPRKITVDQKGIEALLAACQNSAERLIIILLSQTGLRAAEACNLVLSDINFEKRFIQVRYAKWGKSRRVGLPNQVAEAIETYLAFRPHTTHEFLLMNRDEQQLERSGLRQRVERISLRAGVPAHPHALRRAFVTINANMGKPLVMLQIACGHSDIATTRSYCMTTEDEVVESMSNWHW
jgi:integrase/recombinase XerD